MVCNFALFKHAPLACMCWICLCMAKRFTHERPSTLTTNEWSRVIDTIRVYKRIDSFDSIHILTHPCKELGLLPFIEIFYTLVLLLLFLLAVHPWLLGMHHLYTYTLLKKVSTLSVDATLDAGYMFILILLLVQWYPPLEVQLWWRRRYSILVHWRRKDHFVLTKFSPLRCLLVSPWLGNSWSAERPGSYHRHVFCCSNLWLIALHVVPQYSLLLPTSVAVRILSYRGDCHQEIACTLTSRVTSAFYFLLLGMPIWLIYVYEIHYVVGATCHAEDGTGTWYR